ncbi:MAG: hypothetical protein FIB08_17580 [Candidatus Methanoperedens sp.]|nr:hypothetical protein [Candidatus Methanoperedens sp.]
MRIIQTNYFKEGCVKMEPQSVHTAPGQMAGYIFQLDRALYWLAASQRGAKVGIEAFVDDIAVINEGKLAIFEQDKLSISPYK